MGAVDDGSSALEEAMLTGKLSAKRSKKVAKMVGGGGKFTPNQILMAAAGGLWSEDPAVFRASLLRAKEMIEEELVFGPSWKEVGCPDSHQGMYLLGRVGIVAASLRPGAEDALVTLGAGAATLISQELRLGDLVATPDGDVRGLPGMRAPNGAALGRLAATTLWREVRRRQVAGIVHRGTGGKQRTLKWKAGEAGYGGSDPLIDGPGYWFSQLLDTPKGKALLEGPLSRSAPLPKKLRLPLTVARWSGGTLAWFDDPGESERHRFVVHGSAAANRERGGDGDEDPVVWIKVHWESPAKHKVEVSSTWETPPPPFPEDSTKTRIEGMTSSEIAGR